MHFTILEILGIYKVYRGIILNAEDIYNAHLSIWWEKGKYIIVKVHKLACNKWLMQAEILQCILAMTDIKVIDFFWVYITLWEL